METAVRMLLPNQCMTNRPRTFFITQTWCAWPIASINFDDGRGGPHHRQKWLSSVQLNWLNLSMRVCQHYCTLQQMIFSVFIYKSRTILKNVKLCRLTHFTLNRWAHNIYCLSLNVMLSAICIYIILSFCIIFMEISIRIGGMKVVNTSMHTWPSVRTSSL